MTIKKKKSSVNQPQFAGIVVTASTKGEAIDRFRLAATGNDAQALQSESGSYTLVTTSANLEHDFHDVVTGAGNMVEVDSNIESASSNGQDEAEVFMTVCADGCGDVIISESADVVKHCPSCATEIPSLSNEEIHELTELENSESSDLPQGDQGAIVSASSFEEAHDLYFEVMSGQNVVGLADPSQELNSQSSDQALTFVTHSSCEYEYSPYIGEQGLAESEVTLDSQSSTEDSFQGNYLICESSDCPAPHIISTHNEPVFCPSCSSGLIDPEDLADLQDSVSESEIAFEEDLDSESMGCNKAKKAKMKKKMAALGDDEDMSDEDLSDEDDLESDSMADDSDEDMSDDDSDGDIDLEIDESDDDLSDEDDLESDSMADDEEDEDDLEEDLDDLDDLGDDEDLDLDDDFGEDDESDMDSESTNVELNLLQAIAATEGQLESEYLFVANCGNINGIDTWTAFYRNTPIATLSSNNVSENIAKIFNSPALGDAIKVSVSENGVEQGLANIGFNPIKPDVDFEIAVSQNLLDEADAKVEQALASVEQREADFAERFEAACATAIMGMNRNAFKGVTNPLRDSLVATLSAAGLRNPEQLVDNAFASTSDAYSRILLAQTKSISSKSPEVQNEIADTISNLNFLSQSSGQEVEPIGNPVQAPETNTVVQQDLESESGSATMKSRIKSLNLGKL